MRIGRIGTDDLEYEQDSGKAAFSQLSREARPGEDALQGERQGSTSHSPPRRASRDCISPPPKGGGHGPWANHGSLAKLVASKVPWPCAVPWATEELVVVEAHGPVAPPFGGEYSRERLAEGSPDGPP